jgi:hypothetical protein
MSSAEYAAYLARGVALTPFATKEEASEKQLHQYILEECRRRDLPCVHARLDLPHSCGIGTPDFVVALPGGRTLWVEAKVGKNKLTRAQAAWMAMLIKHGHDTAVVRSFRQFISLLNPKPQTQP